MASRSKSEIIMFVPREGRFAHTIRQEEIEELMRRSRELTEARDRYLQLRDYLKAALRSGAVVESGSCEARLQSLMRSGYSVRPGIVERLLIRYSMMLR